MQLQSIKIALAVSLSALLAACGGGGGGGDDAPPPPPAPVQVSGKFVDSNVQGLRWESNELSGITDAAGTYQYMTGDSVKFYVGDIFLGESEGFSVIIPVDIVPGAVNIDNPTVLNIARFILTLDDDDNWDNGIQITQVVSDLAAGESLNFAVATDTFANSGEVQTLVATMTAAKSGAAGPTPLVRAIDAREHLRLTISELLAGSYSGTYTGDFSGTWTGTVNLNGDFTGTATPDSGGDPIVLEKIEAVSGDGSGKAGFGASGGALGDSTAEFTGIFRTDGNASGSWEDDGGANTGSWSGSKN